MGSDSHHLCPRYSGPLTTTAPAAIREWATFILFCLFKYQTKTRRTAKINFLAHMKMSLYKWENVLAELLITKECG